MGVIEVFKRQQREEAKLEGKLEGRLEGKFEGKLEGEAQKSHAVVVNLIKKLGFSNEQAADVAEVSIAVVEKVRKELEDKQ